MVWVVLIGWFLMWLVRLVLLVFGFRFDLVVVGCWVCVLVLVV